MMFFNIHYILLKNWPALPGSHGLGWSLPLPDYQVYHLFKMIKQPFFLEHRIHSGKIHDVYQRNTYKKIQ